MCHISIHDNKFRWIPFMFYSIRIRTHRLVVSGSRISMKNKCVDIFWCLNKFTQKQVDIKGKFLLGYLFDTTSFKPFFFYSIVCDSNVRQIILGNVISECSGNMDKINRIERNYGLKVLWKFTIRILYQLWAIIMT